MGKDSQKALEAMGSRLKQINEAANLSEGSALYEFNQSTETNKWFEVTYDCYYMLAKSKEIYEKTDKAFNVAISPLTRLWNVDIDGIAKYKPDLIHSEEPLIMPSALPVSLEIENELLHTDLFKLLLKTEDGKYFIAKTDGLLQLDLGGIAKGYGVDECKKICDEYKLESCLIDVSRNLYLYKKYYNGSSFIPWAIGLVSPRPRDNTFRDDILAMEFTDISVATSGDYERYYYYAYGEGDHFIGDDDLIAVPHIINPRNGLPIGVAFDGKFYKNVSVNCSVTVIHSSSLLADSYGTAIAVMDFNEGIQFMKENGLSGIIITSDKKMAIIGDVKLYKTDVYDKYKEYQIIYG